MRLCNSLELPRSAVTLRMELVVTEPLEVSGRYRSRFRNVLLVREGFFQLVIVVLHYEERFFLLSLVRD